MCAKAPSRTHFRQLCRLPILAVGQKLNKNCINSYLYPLQSLSYQVKRIKQKYYSRYTNTTIIKINKIFVLFQNLKSYNYTQALPTCPFSDAQKRSKTFSYTQAFSRRFHVSTRKRFRLKTGIFFMCFRPLSTLK